MQNFQEACNYKSHLVKEMTQDNQYLRRIYPMSLLLKPQPQFFCVTTKYIIYNGHKSQRPIFTILVLSYAVERGLDVSDLHLCECIYAINK